MKPQISDATLAKRVPVNTELLRETIDDSGVSVAAAGKTKRLP